MDEPRWLLDEMLGRLARYLRFVGHDAEYVRDTPDDEIARRAVRERRVLVTRDRALSRRVASSLLLHEVHIADQLREVRASYPNLSFEVVFERCTLCNTMLVPFHPNTGDPWPVGLPPARATEASEVYQCPRCGHLYWEGSHTAHIRAQIASWLTSEAM